MVKRITVSVSDELYGKIQSAKQGFSKEFSVSKIVQQALENELEDAKARAYVWHTGFDDGVEYVQSLSSKERINAKKMVFNFPRKYPDDLTELLMKAGFIELNNLEKLKTHLSILEYWKCIFKRFEFQENMSSSWSWPLRLSDPLMPR
jgi:post-segregation antitoxin (ccd killing protein)